MYLSGESPHYTCLFLLTEMQSSSYHAGSTVTDPLPTKCDPSFGFSKRGFSIYGVLYSYGCMFLEYVWVTGVEASHVCAKFSRQGFEVCILEPLLNQHFINHHLRVSDSLLRGDISSRCSSGCWETSTNSSEPSRPRAQTQRTLNAQQYINNNYVFVCFLFTKQTNNNIHTQARDIHK